MTPDKNTTCLGFEYVCKVGDELWKMSDEELIKQATKDLERTGFAKGDKVKDGKVVRIRHVYPIYHLGYQEKVAVIRDYLTRSISNLFPIGRGGMHKYNNSDHSMMTALLQVRNLIEGADFDVWKVNTDAEYQEELILDKRAVSVA